MIGKSHYHVEEYTKSERYLLQFVDRYKDSDLIVEAYLWLGRSLLNQDKNDEALEQLNKVIAAEEDDELTAQAYLSVGRIYYNMEAYDLARTQLNQIQNYSGDDQLEAEAQYIIAKTYFDSGAYAKAAGEFEKVQMYDASTDLNFSAIMKRVECLEELENYDQAVLILEESTEKGEFLPRKSVLKAKIGDIYKIQGKFLEATEIYNSVVEAFPRTEGSAISFYGLAQLMEFAYSDLDSARSLYLQVGREYRESDLKQTAEDRAKILDQYQKISQNIQKDLSDLAELMKLDQPESVLQSDTTSKKKETEVKNQETATKLRNREEIINSLEHNRFALAEFFLLTMSNYDSAAASYKRFVATATDTILIPKALYALHYIYLYGKEDISNADTFRQQIMTFYPNTPYAAFFKSDYRSEQDSTDNVSVYKYAFLQAEALMFNQQYIEAIEYYTQIAVEDSGSLLAQKARYATAWIYEKHLDDLQSAIEAYSTIAKEYPNTRIGKIAKNKIKQPANEAEIQLDNQDKAISPADTLNLPAETEEFPAPGDLNQ